MATARKQSKSSPKRQSKSKQSPPPPADSLDHIAKALWPLAVDIHSVSLDPKNARKHEEKDLRAVAESLKRYGQRVPLVVNQRTGYIEKGNGTWRAAVDILGWSTIAVIYVDDDPTTATGFALADNRTAELSEWDEANLAEAIATLQIHDEEFYDFLQLQALLPDDSGDSSADAPEATIPAVYGVNVDCGDEEKQQEVYVLLREQFPDLEVKLVTM